MRRWYFVNNFTNKQAEQAMTSTGDGIWESLLRVSMSRMKRYDFYQFSNSEFSELIMYSWLGYHHGTLFAAFKSDTLSALSYWDRQKLLSWQFDLTATAAARYYSFSPWRDFLIHFIETQNTTENFNSRTLAKNCSLCSTRIVVGEKELQRVPIVRLMR